MIAKPTSHYIPSSISLMTYTPSPSMVPTIHIYPQPKSIIPTPPSFNTPQTHYSYLVFHHTHHHAHSPTLHAYCIITTPTYHAHIPITTSSHHLSIMPVTIPAAIPIFHLLNPLPIVDTPLITSSYPSILPLNAPLSSPFIAQSVIPTFLHIRLTPMLITHHTRYHRTHFLSH